MPALFAASKLQALLILLQNLLLPPCLWCHLRSLLASALVIMATLAWWAASLDFCWDSLTGLCVGGPLLIFIWSYRHSYVTIQIHSWKDPHSFHCKFYLTNKRCTLLKIWKKLVSFLPTVFLGRPSKHFLGHLRTYII